MHAQHYSRCWNRLEVTHIANEQWKKDRKYRILAKR